jgi:hypothetical protein
MKASRTVLLVCVLALAFGFVEACVVVYLRQAYYPEGFAFPLKPGVMPQVAVELARELATIVMLVCIAMIAGRTRWQRISYFLIAFGVWDVFYYVWLKVIVNWPASLLEWDVLFLIPLPWIGPVISPILVSLVMIAGGWLILRKEEQVGGFRASITSMLLTLVGSALILCSYLIDLDASLRFQFPKPYRYELLIVGLICYAIAFVVTARTATAARSN